MAGNVAQRLYADEQAFAALCLILDKDIPIARRRTMWDELRDDHYIYAGASAKHQLITLPMYKMIKGCVRRTNRIPTLHWLLQQPGMSADTQSVWMAIDTDKALESDYALLIEQMDAAFLARQTVAANKMILDMHNSSRSLAEIKEATRLIARNLDLAVSKSETVMSSIDLRSDGVDAAANWAAAFQRVAGVKPHLQHWSTGFPTVDAQTNGGMRGKELWLYAAPVGRGKTAAATHTALTAYRNGARVRYYSLEISEDVLLGRALASLTGTPYVDYEAGLDEVAYKAQRADLWRRHIGATQGRLQIMSQGAQHRRPDVASIAATLEEDPVDLLVIDYIGLMDVREDKKLNEEQGLRLAANDLKALAMRTGTTILLLAQLGKDGDLKYAKSIKEAADFYLWWDADSKDVMYRVNTEKHRRWRDGSVDGFWVVPQWSCSRFAEATPDEVDRIQAQQQQTSGAAKLARMDGM